MVSPAPVVLLDEPTTSLDAEAARQVTGAIRSATRDRTVLLVTHDPVLAAIADRTVHVSPLWRQEPVPSGAARPGASAPDVAPVPIDHVAAGADPSWAHSGGPRRGEEVTTHVDPGHR